MSWFSTEIQLGIYKHREEGNVASIFQTTYNQCIKNRYPVCGTPKSSDWTDARAFGTNVIVYKADEKARRPNYRCIASTSRFRQAHDVHAFTLRRFFSTSWENVFSLKGRYAFCFGHPRIKYVFYVKLYCIKTFIRTFEFNDVSSYLWVIKLIDIIKSIFACWLNGMYFCRWNFDVIFWYRWVFDIFFWCRWVVLPGPNSTVNNFSFGWVGSGPCAMMHRIHFVFRMRNSIFRRVKLNSMS